VEGLLLRQAAARAVGGARAALGPALDAATAQDARGFLRHAGRAGHARPG
jgi:hypothetical protein